MALRMVTISPSSSSRFCIICDATHEAVSASTCGWVKALTHKKSCFCVFAYFSSRFFKARERQRKHVSNSLTSID